MEKNDTNKARAAYTLSDEIIHMRIRLKRAETALREPTDGYFNKGYDKNTGSGRFAILWEYERQGIFCDIAADYLYEIGQTLNNLSELVQEGIDITRKEEEIDNA